MAATNTFNNLGRLNHHHHSTTHDIPPPPSTAATFFLEPSTFSPLSSHHHLHSLIISSTKTFSVSPTTSFSTSLSSSSSESDTFEQLQQHLAAQNFREADEETRRLLIVLAGEAAQKRGYVFFSEVQFIPEADLKAIDDLWRQHSNNRFGYSVQKRIFFDKVNQDFTNFFIRVGWMKKLDTEVDQYNYRAFPNEFIWELNDDTPEGHLPLTNALRGTQLLKCILNHPAFKNTEEKEERLLQAGMAAGEGNKAGGGLKGLMDASKPLNKRVLKSDYSF
ncbi:tetrapyrrole-binding protein, chloroplastic [Argentina anserina]|uniref:tetrapyrrole-binding protein, chloroplastic n=1 Tax=Argentina anserina TaxID=57926 RepID=UPI0021762B7D|nr:tetrapyrrole-binding protein, chloroplastic [Potentilla anserina]